MQLDKRMLEAITRRAYGFYYDEENVEYESKNSGKYLLCKNKNRVYFGSGYLKIKIKKLFSASARIEFRVVKVESGSGKNFALRGRMRVKTAR